MSAPSKSLIRIGVVGIGKMGSLHLQKFSALSGVEMVGILDPATERIKALSEQHSVPIFNSLEDLLIECDGLVIACPTAFHFSIAQKALVSGVNVLVEKPIAHTSKEAKALIDLAKKKNLIFQSGFLERHRLQILLEGFELDRIKSIQCTRYSPQLGREPGLDVILDLMIHDLDLVMSLYGSEPVRWKATGISVVSPTWDCVDVFFEFPCGGMAVLKANRSARESVRQMSVLTETSSLQIDFLLNQAEWKRKGLHSKIEQMVSERKNLDPLALQAQNFIESIQMNKQPRVSGLDGYRSILWAERIQESLLEVNPPSASQSVVQFNPNA